MSANQKNIISAASQHVVTNKVRILKVAKPARGFNSKLLSMKDGESIGFDPYDTASLFVDRTQEHK
jgi:hypothetical protein